jgi:hypothetical protein
MSESADAITVGTHVTTNAEDRLETARRHLLISTAKVYSMHKEEYLAAKGTIDDIKIVNLAKLYASENIYTAINTSFIVSGTVINKAYIEEMCRVWELSYPDMCDIMRIYRYLCRSTSRDSNLICSKEFVLYAHNTIIKIFTAARDNIEDETIRLLMTSPEEITALEQLDDMHTFILDESYFIEWCRLTAANPPIYTPFTCSLDFTDISP